jgi:outer membrane receptor protein involved in Fe transport
MKRTVSFLIRFAAAVACGGALFIDVAAAQSATHEFRIAQEPLDQALRDFALASGVDLMFSPDLVAGKTSPALKGTFTIDEGLRTLLRGSGLEFTVAGSRVVISRAKANAARQATSPTAGTGTLNGDTSLAQAQDDGSAARKQGPEKPEDQGTNAIELEEVSVTGSRIRGAPPASPVTILTREEMAQAGYTDLGDAGRGLLQNFSGGMNPGVAGGGNQGGVNNLNNSSVLDLRGLGPDATLTLINGHRVAYDAASQGVDISAIPIAAVERIEVVADGASALYGSDAVGGVANVILRRDFEGLQAAARYGGSTDGGNQQQEYSVTTGTRWASGGMIATLDDSRYTAINASDRSYTQGLVGSQTLVPGQRQHSAVIAGHQQLTDGLELTLDAYLNDRTSELINDFTTTEPVTSSGVWNYPQRVESSEVTPTLRYQLPGGWETSLSGTYARSKTTLFAFVFLGADSYSGGVLYDNVTNSGEFDAEGPLFSAPGGEARLAAGGGYRSASLHAEKTHTMDGITTTPKNFTDSRNVYFGYGELSVPFVGASQNRRFAHSLTFSAAARYENYKGLWSVTTPKLGLIFEPTSDITVRMTWGKSFKAATLYQEDTLASAFLLGATNYAPPPSGGRPVITVSGGHSVPLQPERATTWTASIGFHPSLVQGLSMEATYFGIRYRERIASPISSTYTALGNPIYNPFITYDPTAQQVLAVIDNVPAGFANYTGQPFDPANVGAIIDDSLRNVARATASGVDFTSSYDMDVGVKSHLSLTASASYLESDNQLSAGQPAVQLAGVIFNPPHWRGRTSATWQRANLTLTGTVNYLGGEQDNRYPPVEWVGSFTTLDLVAQIRSTASAGFFRDFEVGFSALNVLNRKPATIRNSDPTNPPYDSLNYSTIGRFFGVTVTKRFL